MYLAPLNYDRFFKKVFSHTHIAKAFLEDFLDVEITEITLLETAKYLTDDAAKVEIDFRCKINGSDIIIEMQQWYKPDVVLRFYLYHCLSTALQLETLPEKKVPSITDDKRAKDKNYKNVIPAITLIWMVDDSLHFKENFIGYTTAPEKALDFLENQELWESGDIAQLLDLRKQVLEVLQNKHKNLDFLRKNRLIFMLQDNIVKDEKFTKYHPWFEFAEKTRNKLNEKEDFKDYVQLDLFKDIMRIISKDNLAKEDLTYIDSEDENIKLVNRALQDERDSGFEEGYGEGIEKGMEKGIEQGIEQGIEKSVILLFKNGKTEIEISQWLEISIENVRYIIEKAKKAGLL